VGALASSRPRAWLLVVLPLLAAAVFGLARQRAAVPLAVAAPGAFAGSVNGGCYRAAVNQCAIRVDRWAPVTITPGAQLEAVQLWANGQLLYDFRTDVSNAPSGSYQLSPVKQDFAARCGASYVLEVLVKDTQDPALAINGQTNSFTCPTIPLDAFAVYAPLLIR
jgi:hypothetical protein